MIPMQSSLSSPVHTHASPPVSPTVTHISKSPVPSPPPSPTPEGSRIDAVVERPRRRSPARSSDSNQTLSLRRSEDATGRRSHNHHQSAVMNSSVQKPIVAQPKAPSRGHSRHGSVDISAPAPAPALVLTDKPTYKPLLQDVSLYTNPHLTRDTENTTLEELAHIVRLSKYQERKRANTRTRLQRSLISTALSARLTRSGEAAHRHLVDNFRRDEKENFAMLYNAIHDVRKSCEELRRFSLLEPDMESLSGHGLGSSESLETPTNSTAGPAPQKHAHSFLHDISSSSRTTFIDFLTQIRTNPDYLATRICALTSTELNTFLTHHKGLEPIESVLPFHSRAGGRPHASASSRGTINMDIERLLSFQRHDPLSILIHTCFANSAGPDSSEDQRRTDVWATALARLISEPKSNGEQFLLSVLNIWTSMRDWSGKTQMEWYLMKILKDGAFLLERAEDQHGTRFNVSDWNHSDEIAAREFYNNAVNDLFEMIDDDDSTGIPEGLLELGNAILAKLEDKYVENTSRWLVWRCLFFVFLLGVIIHPEAYGMLVDYHITPYAREKILRKVAMKAHEYVSSMWSGKPSATCTPVEIPSKIKSHVGSILARFQGSRSKVSAAKLLPARSITSLRETKEVHPYLVTSPADLATLVNALFPERRPMSASGNFRSAPTSISGMSAQPVPYANSRSFDTASIISTTVGMSEVNGIDETNIPTPQAHSPPSMDPETERRLGKYEDDGFRLRLALHELSQVLGAEVLRGSCHPCAERWMVLFISSDGQGLSTHMTYDPDDDLEDEENTSSSDTDDDESVNGTRLDKDYHQLRDSILRLVVDYEIPRNLEPETAQLSNRASGLKKYKSRNKLIIPENTMSSRNPYRKQLSLDTSNKSPDTSKQDSRSSSNEEGPEAVLITMLKAASAQSKAQSDFVSSHAYWRTLTQLNALESSSLRYNGFSALINIFSRGPRDSIRRSAAAIEEYDAWLIWLKQSQERHEGLIDRMMKRVRAIRDKMWYVTDVRNSKEYAHSRDVCQALKSMGMPRRWNSFQRSRSSMDRGHNSFIRRAESQIMDMLAVSEDQGGPNKLRDDQAEKTKLWLNQCGVENFCQGEERIHRFSCEVDQCISQLVGETIREAPVLWSSELFKRDKAVYDRLRARDRGEGSWTGDDASSILSATDSRYTSSSGRPGSLSRELRSVSSQNTSQHSFDSSRHLSRPTATLSEILDGPEYFDKSSPINDATGTFWTPFHPTSPGSGSRAYSPTTSLTNLSTTFSGPNHGTLPSNSSISTGRPGTSASSNETVYQHRPDDEKTRFLNELKQSLTSLLLSDLGSQVLSKGSETDSWFEKVGQQCIERKDALDRRARRKTEKREEKREKEKQMRSSTRPRVIEKKKSFGNLRGAGDAIADERAVESFEGPSTPRLETPISVGDAGGQNQATKEKSSSEFPFKKAYQRLLNMFCVHPNPYAKLNALNELENLIVASLSTSTVKRPRWNRSDAGSSVVQENSQRPTPLDGTIDNVRERRSHTLQSSFATNGFPCPSRLGSETRSISSAGAGNTDAITKELQTLFRDASIRPKSLFRDLQLISAFVPSSVLDRPEKGKAFWNTGLAALKLKSEVCRMMIEIADEVVAVHTHQRNTLEGAINPDMTQSSTGTPPPPSTSYKLEDAGKMYVITAKEGYPTAQRELALLYLSNPESVERTTLPLSKPREVFKQTVMDKYGRTDRGRMTTLQGVNSLGGNGMVGRDTIGDASGVNEGDVRNDPHLMCVAVHWMEAAEQGGDELASSFLRQNGFMGLN